MRCSFTMTEESVVLCWVLHCYATLHVPPLNGGGVFKPVCKNGAQVAKGNIYIYMYISKRNKEWFCPWGHVGLERNDSRCRPPETNCHWPPWIFQGTLDWKWTIQFPTGSLAISSLCITGKGFHFWVRPVGWKYSQTVISIVQELSSPNYSFIYHLCSVICI